MKVTWQVDDGYAGKSRPQHSLIPDEELEGLSEEEREEFIDDWVREDFENRISYYILWTS